MGFFKNNDLERMVAFVIDAIIVGCISSLIFNILYEPEAIRFDNNSQLFPFLAYFVFFDYANHGQTLGKVFLNIGGHKQWDFKKRITRSFLKLISIFLMPITLIVYLVKGKIMHDLLLDSLEVAHNP